MGTVQTTPYSPNDALPKECCCGLIHDFDDWLLLPYCGIMRGVDELPDLELRHCACGSTLAVPLATDPRA